MSPPLNAAVRFPIVIASTWSLSECAGCIDDLPVRWTQSCYQHRRHTQEKRDEECEMQPVQERCQRGREPAHTAAIDEDLPQHCHCNLAQPEWEDDGDAEVLPPGIRHIENTGSPHRHLRPNRTLRRVV